MHVEDGDELPISITIYEEEPSQAYWHCQVAVLPRPGDYLVIASAPAGDRHIVKRIVHAVGLGRHKIDIWVEKTL
ncbi:hypothetical protein [Mesorhizobium silamurunense]|uniref:hypothetical protein n=1 Tax=Mesorhizobium silamurunense TaxID=499528 RepID=UPI00177B9EDC|nr:hypothetical protein [Mesorhizobium silamurunense]